MKPNDTSPARSRYLKVLDGRSQPIRGLWKTRKTGVFYAQLQVEGKTAWIPLPKATTRAQAVDELNKLKTERKEGKLLVVKHAPKLVDAIESFKADARFQDKRASTTATRAKSAGRVFMHSALKACRTEAAALGADAIIEFGPNGNTSGVGVANPMGAGAWGVGSNYNTGFAAKAIVWQD